MAPKRQNGLYKPDLTCNGWPQWRRVDHHGRFKVPAWMRKPTSPASTEPGHPPCSLRYYPATRRSPGEWQLQLDGRPINLRQINRNASNLDAWGGPPSDKWLHAADSGNPGPAGAYRRRNRPSPGEHHAAPALALAIACLNEDRWQERVAQMRAEALATLPPIAVLEFSGEVHSLPWRLFADRGSVGEAVDLRRVVAEHVPSLGGADAFDLVYTDCDDGSGADGGSDCIGSANILDQSVEARLLATNGELEVLVAFREAPEGL